MKKMLILISLFMVLSLVNGALKTDRAHIGLRKLTNEDYQKIDELPILELPQKYRNRNLPTVVDNSEHKYFRPVFNQSGGCCSHASSIAYIFTYEINAARDLDASFTENQYPTHYTWNFLNFGQAAGTWPLDAMFIARDNGIPNVVDYGGSLEYGGSERWLTGYYKYKNSIGNRISEIYKLNLRKEEGLITLKNWFFDHIDGDTVGGIASFVANSSGMNIKQLPAGTEEAGKDVVINWALTSSGTMSDHAMTFVGYNDSIRYDYNGDGVFSNDQDINGDGIIDMKDWEIGAIIVANSWGSNWSNNGFIYMPYKLLAESIFNGGIGERGNVYLMKAHKKYQPKITYKVKVKHNIRRMLKINAGIAIDTSATIPEHTITFPLFTHQGGTHYMQGGNTEADKYLELGLDVTPLLSFVEENSTYKLFLEVIEKDPTEVGNGEIISFTVKDYQNEEQSFICPETEVEIKNNETTYLSIVKQQSEGNLHIVNNTLPNALVGENYNFQLQGIGGVSPYTWSMKMNYSETNSSGSMPDMSSAESLPLPGGSHFYITKNLNFNFPFYNKEYSEITIDSNGGIYFDNEFFFGWTFEDLIAQNKVIAPYLVELIFNNDNGITYLEKENSVIVKWQGNNYCYPSATVEFACELFSDGNIKFYYGDISTNPLSWSGGLSNGDKGNYKLLKFSDTYQANNKIVTLTPTFDQTQMSKFDINLNGMLSADLTEIGNFQIPIQMVDAAFVKREKTLELSSDATNTPYLVVDSIYTTDSDLICGQENKISLILKNIGTETANDITLKLIVDSLAIANIGDDEELIAELIAGEEIIIEDAFTITPHFSSDTKLDLLINVESSDLSFIGGTSLKLENLELEIKHFNAIPTISNENIMKLNYTIVNKSNFDAENLKIDINDLSNYSAPVELEENTISLLAAKDTTTVSIDCDITDIISDHELDISFRIYLRDSVLFKEVIFPMPVKHFISEEGFENGLPVNWDFVDNNNDNFIWQSGSNYLDISAYEGSSYIYIDAEEEQADDWIVLPPVNSENGMRLVFRARSKGYSPRGKFNIMKSSNGSNISDFTETIDNGSPFVLWKEFSFDIPANKNGEQYLAIQCISNAGAVLYIDDLHFETVYNDINDEFLVIFENKLLQNYPNPFNPSTNIRFNLNENGVINLNIYNIKGELINSFLKNKNLNSGIHTYKFSGANLPSGIYYYGLSVNGKTVGYKKMILVK